MRDFTIHGKRVIREVITFLVCFVITFLLNILAIIIYKAHFVELFSSLHYVLVFSLALYFAWCIIRLLLVALKQIVGPNKNKQKKI